LAMFDASFSLQTGRFFERCGLVLTAITVPQACRHGLKVLR
jgi:hypothetical protein